MSKSRKTNTYKSLFLSIERSRKLIKEQLTKALIDSGIRLTFDQWLVLSEISANRGINQKNLAGSLHKEVASISRILNKLQSATLVTRKENPENKREFHLYLTHEGLEIIESFAGFEEKNLNPIFSSIYERELNLIVNVLNRLEKDIN
ncbi:MarR family transcriptional regulator [Saprospiraceae bacterium]|nr:MarR family transcriptional regulator [Saprospiraceae bacterium]